MALFSTEFIAFTCSNPQAVKQWWIKTFDCTEVEPPQDWDDPLPSDIALKMPGAELTNMLLRDLAEVRAAGYERADEHSILFCSKLKNAAEWLRARGVATGPV